MAAQDRRRQRARRAAARLAVARRGLGRRASCSRVACVALVVRLRAARRAQRDAATTPPSRRAAHGERLPQRALRAPAAPVARVPQPARGRRSPLPADRRHLRHPDAHHERLLPDPHLDRAAGRHAGRDGAARLGADAGRARRSCRCCSSPSALSAAHHRARDRRAREGERALGGGAAHDRRHPGDPGVHDRGGGAPPLRRRASSESLAANLRLYTLQTRLLGVRQRADRRRHGGGALVRRDATCCDGHAHGRRRARLHHLSRVALRADQQPDADATGSIQGAKVGAERVFEILETEPDLADGTRELARGEVHGAVTLRGRALRLRRRAGRCCAA